MSKNIGSCHCGKINFQLNSAPQTIVNCHCSFCRSHSGASLSTYVFLPLTDFEITSGQDELKTYEIEDGTKHFCSACGTPIFNLSNKYPEACTIYLGTLEKVEEYKPVVNIWYKNKLSWLEGLSSILSLDSDTSPKPKG